MKKQNFYAAKVLTVCTLLLCASLSAFAVNRNWRLNPDPDAKADFASINEAMQDERVIPGDFLILDPGYYEGTQTVTKENITISGQGYFLSQNYNWPDATQATIQDLQFSKAGKVQGCYLERLYLCNNVEVFRCHIYMLSSSHVSGVTIESCFFSNGFNNSFESSTFRNNIINGTSDGRSAGEYENSIIEYNTIVRSYKYCLSCKNSTIRNNIIINQSENGSGNVALHDYVY